jgi:hypothetical protein
LRRGGAVTVRRGQRIVRRRGGVYINRSRKSGGAYGTRGIVIKEALLTFQESVEVPPELTEDGEAEKALIVGRAVEDPPRSEASSVMVACWETVCTIWFELFLYWI